MKTSYRAGFTVIEISLFLGITGLLVVGILMTTGSSIATQRYRDSVASLKSTLQEQYSKVSSTSNTRGNNWRCDAGVVSEGGSSDARGQSDCQIIGRIITTNTSRSQLYIRDVIGYAPSSAISASNDIDALRAFTLRPSPIDTQTYTIEWDALMGTDAGGVTRFTVMILRSPTTGVIRTFVHPTRAISDSELRNIVTTGYLDTELRVCVRPNAASAGGGLMAVAINKGATSASGVESLGESMNSCR